MLMMIISKSLLYDFSTLAIQHTFMGHFLVTCCCVIIHLMSFRNTLTVRSNSSLSLCLVCFTNRFAIGTNLSWATIWHSLESALTVSNLAVHAIHHTIAHLFHHFVHASERFSIKKRVIFKGVIKTKSLKHAVSHLVHFIVVPLHHIKHRVSTVWHDHSWVWRSSVIRLYRSVSVCHK